MFTGIVQEIGEIVEVKRDSSLLRYGLSCSKKELELGASLAINGICQTVISIEELLYFEATEETLRCTTLGSLKKGDHVHIERPLKFGGHVGGHLLSGHIAERSKILAISDNIYTFSCDKPQFLINKGYIALDGVSLTACNVDNDSFQVHFIPETLSRTTFSKKVVGHLVNLEYDPMTQTIVETINRIRSKNP